MTTGRVPRVQGQALLEMSVFLALLLAVGLPQVLTNVTVVGRQRESCPNSEPPGGDGAAVGPQGLGDRSGRRSCGPG